MGISTPLRHEQLSGAAHSPAPRCPGWRLSVPGHECIGSYQDIAVFEGVPLVTHAYRVGIGDRAKAVQREYRPPPGEAVTVFEDRRDAERSRRLDDEASVVEEYPHAC